MLENVKDIYMAKLELAKLEGVESVSNLLAKTFSIFVQILASIVGIIALLILVAVVLGYMLDSYILGITIFCVVLLMMVLATLFLRNQFIVTPIKNIILKSIYEGTSSK